MFDELIAPLLTTQWGRRAGLALLALLGGLIVLTFGNMLWEWHADLQLIKAASYPSNNQIQAENQLAELITQIPEWHLYGNYGMTQTDILPVTSLQIKLVGVIKATSDAKSRVIISEAGGPGKVYQVGDTLPSSGVKVYSITNDGVVLDNSGRLEKLPLQRAPLQFQGMPKALLGD